MYRLGFTISQASGPDLTEPTWLSEIQSSWQAFAPAGWFVFEGASWAIFASGNGEPWPFDAPEVGFQEVTEEYYEEDIPDYDRW